MRIIATLLEDLSLKDITPQSILTDLNIQALIYALDPEIKAITDETMKPALLSQVNSLDDDILAHLSWQNHVDFYDLAATSSMKRETVGNALKLHMKKGTVWAIKEALRQLDIEAEIIPWWEYDGEPYTFKVKAAVTGEFYRTEGRDALMSNLIRAVNDTKSARSSMINLQTDIHDTQSMQLYAAACAILTGDVIVRPVTPELSSSFSIYTGVGMALYYDRTISLDRVTQFETDIYVGVAVKREFHEEIEVDLDIMQELLLQFEQRIFDRLDANERVMQECITSINYDVVSRLERIERLLTWVEPEEEQTGGND